MEDGWDLHAVVKSCASSVAAADNTPAAMDLHEEVHKELIAAASVATTVATTSISFDDGRSAHEQPAMSSNFISFSMIKPLDSEHHARKMKSKHHKRVVKLREEELNNDGWAWRKYGQKPIKGSPYPSCASSVAAADNTPAAMDLHEEVHKELTAAASVATTVATTSISFDDGRSAHEQPAMSSNFISFSMIKPLDSEHHARKRKSKHHKRVVKLREEELNNDGWAWRKYGQKPIKGSPYPRCSTTKDCLARRQVERNLPPCSSSSSPASTSSFSPATSLKEDENEMNDKDIDELIKNY
ncbi:hypothetical protein L1987_75998 [Smallanthus sonchifolius]|uniref:Uncharacterized protein n=1 Tax=Smallanthus sonchifolius TaxID=185202 RepID=A0ACB9A6B8_9ASTR|nr:hypothetical protein L1987_75998 [Smallanthus sonchifolius]